MHIKLTDIGKQFDYKWIIRNFTEEIPSGSRLAIRGHNGSGKSTLIKLLAGYLSQTCGTIEYFNHEKLTSREHIYRYLTISAPYIDLIQEFTVLEMVNFHGKLKHISTPKEIINFAYLEESAHTPVQFLSSGMLQRLKLALCFCTDADLFLFDEPTSNLDAKGIAWYRESLQHLSQQATVVVASNVAHDFPDNALTWDMPRK